MEHCYFPNLFVVFEHRVYVKNKNRKSKTVLEGFEHPWQDSAGFLE